LAERLYSEVISGRMRPFADGIETFPRFVRDLAKQLHKKVRFVIEGKNTPVDREILEKLEAPLIHLLRNALDHGIETPSERLAKGKEEIGIIRLEASHKAGMLAITVSDDGKGIDLNFLRKTIIDKGFVSVVMAEKLNEGELLEYLFLPGFSTSNEVTEVSGRGIGLHVVQNMIEEVGGEMKASLENGLVIRLQLPLTLSVLRALLVEISGEPYAFPLARLQKVLSVPKSEVFVLENQYYFSHEGINIGLIYAYKFLELPPSQINPDTFCVIVIKEGNENYGILVDRFLLEKELVIQELPPGLDKIPGISGGAFTEEGLPVLLIDVPEIIKNIDKMLVKGAFVTPKNVNENTIGDSRS